MGQHSHNNIMSSESVARDISKEPGQPRTKAKTSAKTNGYRAEELAKIKNGLQPFEKADTSREVLRTVSSLSTESSTNSVSSDGLTSGGGVVTEPAFSSVQEALNKLNSLGYDEVGRQLFLSYHHQLRLKIVPMLYSHYYQA